MGPPDTHRDGDRHRRRHSAVLLERAHDGIGARELARVHRQAKAACRTRNQRRRRQCGQREARHVLQRLRQHGVPVNARLAVVGNGQVDHLELEGHHPRVDGDLATDDIVGRFHRFARVTHRKQAGTAVQVEIPHHRANRIQALADFFQVVELFQLGLGRGVDLRRV